MAKSKSALQTISDTLISRHRCQVPPWVDVEPYLHAATRADTPIATLPKRSDSMSHVDTAQPRRQLTATTHSGCSTHHHHTSHVRYTTLRTSHTSPPLTNPRTMDQTWHWAQSRPLLRFSRVAALPVFATLLFVTTLLLLGLAGKLGSELVQAKNDPHRKFFGSEGVQALIDDERVFNVGVSIFAKKPVDEVKWPECSVEAELEWNDKFWAKRLGGEPDNMTAAENSLYKLAIEKRDQPQRGWRHEESPCTMLHVPETEELWSGIVARNIT